VVPLYVLFVYATCLSNQSPLERSDIPHSGAAIARMSIRAFVGVTCP